MKMDLEYPYNQDWQHGYLVVNPEGRKTVILFNSDKDRSSTAYARYLLAVKAGRYLTENEEADHIDSDRTNDCIDNLQILTIEQHKEKSLFESPGKTYVEFTCQYCGELFKREIRQIKPYTKYCSKRCGWDSLKKIN